MLGPFFIHFVQFTPSLFRLFHLFMLLLGRWGQVFIKSNRFKKYLFRKGNAGHLEKYSKDLRMYMFHLFSENLSSKCYKKKDICFWSNEL